MSPKRAILGDINSDLIQTYKEIKYRPSEVSSILRAFKEGPQAYLAVRAIDPCSLSATARAARFIYLNRFCFNGLYRTNLSGRFNVPYGGDKSGSIPSLPLLQKSSVFLKRAQLVEGDFEKTLQRVEPGDFVYLDPPFSVTGRRVFNEYNPSIFNRDDITRLRKWLEILDQRNIHFLVSYVESDEAEFLRNGFQSLTVLTRRNIAGFAAKRGKVNELLIYNQQSKPK